MRVLSLFDGISCGRVALERAGIDVSAYYAFEIEENRASRNGYRFICLGGDIRASH